jgi:hypothetical protein
LRAGIDDGLAEFGVKAKSAVSKTIRAPPMTEIIIILFIMFRYRLLHILKSFSAAIKESLAPH